MHTTEIQDELAKALAEGTLSAGEFDRLRVPGLSDTGLIDALIATERLVRYAAALQTRVLGAIAARQASENELIAGVIESEVIGATRWASCTAQRRLYEAADLTTRFPETVDLLHAGQVARLQASALVNLTSHLDPEEARAVQARVLPRMPQQSVASTRKALHRAVLAVDPHSAQKRHDEEKERRHVALYPEPDGMATLSLYTPAQTGTALMAAIDTQAKKYSAADTRNLDQRRADALSHLVLSGAGVLSNGTQHADTNVPALVHVTVSVDTLLGTKDEPGDLKGYGPINAAQARALAFAPGSVWRRLLTAPNGTLLHTDRPRTGPPRVSTGWYGSATARVRSLAARCPRNAAIWTTSRRSTTSSPRPVARRCRRTCTCCAGGTTT